VNDDTVVFQNRVNESFNLAQADVGPQYVRWKYLQRSMRNACELKVVYLPRDVRNASIIIGKSSSEFFLIKRLRLHLLPEDSKCCNSV
jgi:hypothetical protein